MHCLSPGDAENFKVCTRHELLAGLCPLSPCTELRKQAQPAEAPAVSLPLVSLARTELATIAGLELASVEEANVPRVLKSLGQVSHDQTRTGIVRARASGTVREVLVREGDEVKEGQVLATLDSAALGDAKAAHLASLAALDFWTKTAERNRALGADSIVAGKEVLEAEAELRRAQADALKARQRLESFGLEVAEISALGKEEHANRNQLQVASPLSGTVVRRSVTVGDVVSEAEDLSKVVDTTAVWVHLDNHEKDLREVRRGQPVTFFVPGLGIPGFRGKVAWMDSEVDQRTRTIRLRAEVEAALKTIPGAADDYTEQIKGQPMLIARVKEDAAARIGVTRAKALALIEAVGGTPAGEVRQGGRRFPPVVHLARAYRNDRETLGRVIVTISSGHRVPLENLVTLERSSGPTTVSHEWGRRRILVQADVRGRDMGSFVEEAREMVSPLISYPL